jgi:hypothetical protein
MAHQDGRCAADGDAIYVQNTAGCADVDNIDGSGGTAAASFCSMTPVANSLAIGTRSLVVVRGTVSGSTLPFGRGAGRSDVSIIGQQSAVIAGNAASPALDLQQGRFYVRGVKISPSASVGINAVVPNTSLALTLRLDTVTVDSCQKGGILLDGAAFDIKNTIVTNNGPGQSGSTFWGGVFFESAPTAGLTSLSLVSVENNRAPGIVCNAAIGSGSGIFATNNTTGDVAQSCGVSTCSPASPGTCGASP